MRWEDLRVGRGLCRWLSVAMLFGLAGETAFADIIHLCLDGTYYQASPGEGKYLKMGTCGTKNWSYREQTDVLLSSVSSAPGSVQKDLQDVISRSRGMTGVPVAESTLTSKSYQNITNLIPQGSDEQTVQALRTSSPRQCQPGEMPPCGAGECSGLSPTLCRLIRGSGGQQVAVAVNTAPRGHIPVRMKTLTTSNLQLAKTGPGTVENCYFPPCKSEPEFPYTGVVSGVPIGSTISVVDATGQTVSAAQVQRGGEFLIPQPAAQRGSNGPYKICILRPQTPIKCGPVNQPAPKFQDEAAMIHVTGRPLGLPKPNPTNPNPR